VRASDAEGVDQGVRWRRRALKAEDLGVADPSLDKLSLLSGHWLLGQLNKPELDRLGSHARIQRYRANEAIFRKGDPGLTMLAVISGRVKISATSPDGTEVVMNIIDTGEVFGEIALLDGKPRTADATAMGPTELLALDHRDFLSVLDQHPDVSRRIIGILCERLRRTSQQLEDTLFLVQSARLAKTLVRLASEYGVETPAGTRIDLRLSQRELATMVGMRREALNRQLGRWREASLIAVEDGSILIRDRDALRRIADTAD
jgi:CRP-like cAMP-binding protein